jgi:hypothetical protein
VGQFNVVDGGDVVEGRGERHPHRIARKPPAGHEPPSGDSQVSPACGKGGEPGPGLPDPALRLPVVAQAGVNVAPVEAEG